MLLIAYWQVRWLGEASYITRSLLKNYFGAQRVRGVIWQGARCRTGRVPLQSVQHSESAPLTRPSGQTLRTLDFVTPLAKVPDLYCESRLAQNSERLTEPQNSSSADS